MTASQPASATRATPNRLAQETSPYLQQHAFNPVDWYPWADEALQAARAQDRPIFLSIGYSACHWCHVMEHESFENPGIADLMNRYFINIKVDREERPDLDQIYMSAVQLMTRRGGWPMSVFLTPDLKPFFGGTYWPPESRMGMPGFRQILEKVHDAWRNRRTAVLEGAEELTQAVRQMGDLGGERAPLDAALIQQAAQRLVSITDRQHGGFGGAPKFPHAMDLRVMLRGWQRTGEADSLDLARLTLDKMAAGGLYDHLGGGFHRYSTDERWLVPHFEKMLYDNALLVPAYVEAYQATGAADYARVVRETLDYVLREMTQPQGGFYSTQDADSEGEEGKFFVWTEAEVDAVLGPDDAPLFKSIFDVSRPGNWEGHTILNRTKTDAQAAQLFERSPEEVAEIVGRSKARLFAVREQRVKPGRDDKVLTSWNGMMISAMAQAAQVLAEPRYAAAARAAADFLLQTVRSPDGQLLHSYKDGRARFNAYLDDYACLIDGLVDLYQATFAEHYLDEALALADVMRARFADPEAGGFFYTATDHEQLIARQKDNQDSSTPSGNSMAATALLRLGRLCGRADLEQAGAETLAYQSALLRQAPTAAGQALLALDFLLGPTREIAIVDGTDPADTAAVLRTVHARFLPNKVIARKPAGQGDDALSAALAPLLRGKSARDNRTTIYVCEHGTCGLPVVGADALAAQLSR